jgi:pimeloyl-ACP methyl ester carboxylesterase
MTIKRDLSYDFDYNENEVSDKYPLLFLPGLDGAGNYSTACVGKLNVVYDVWKLAISGDDRSTFMELASFVLKALDSFDKPVILVGESFGGLLAPYIAIRAKKGKIAKLVLINPATSFDRTPWPMLAPLLAATGIAYPFVGIAALMAIVPDLGQMQRMSEKIMGNVNSSANAVDIMSTFLKIGKDFSEQLSAETLVWRISKWFGAGTSIMDGKYDQIKTPTLVLIGKNDRLLPSRDEGRRLKTIMTNCEMVEVKEFDIGHALLEDGFLDFADELLKAAVFGGTPVNPILDITIPSKKDMEELERNFGPFLNAVSPVFLSRGKDGMLTRGIDNLPTGLQGRPVLLVGNHQIYGTDCAQIIREFINKKDTLVRGLAHPLVFNDRGGQQVPIMGPTLKKFGAVEVSPAAIFELFKSNSTVMLFPGGAREALHGRGEEYKLFWPEKVDFVRMAGMFDAIIIPFSSIGFADSINIFMDKDDVTKIPFLGDGVMRLSAMLPSARGGDVEAVFPPLFALKKAPERNYFLFGTPFDTRELDIYNKKQCKVLYTDIKESVEDGLATLIKFRESDPYKEFVPRIVYEASSGGIQAPTAPLNLKW